MNIQVMGNLNLWNHLWRYWLFENISTEMDDTEQIALFFCLPWLPQAPGRNLRHDFELLSQQKVIGYLQFSWFWNL